MKKYLIVLCLMLFCSVFAYAKENVVASEKLIKALANCSSYAESGVVNTEGLNINSQKRILGMKDGKCIYEEKAIFAENNLTITCAFTKEQISEITGVMNAYNIVQAYSNEKVDTSSFSAVENNPVVKVWGKYLQDASVCAFK